MSDPIDLVIALDHPNVRAFLRMIRHGEGTADEDGYRRMFGGELFDSFADHPRRAITKKLGGKPITSTAAGAPQFLARTWDGLVKQYGFADFSPKNQDLGCVALIKGRKALEDVVAGRFEQAVMKCNKEWASLPGSPYGQPVVTMARARQEYREAGGTFADQSPNADPSPAPQAFSSLLDFAAVDTIIPTPKESTMLLPPFLLAALPSILDLVPKLATMFSSGSVRSNRSRACPVRIDEVGGGIQAARVASEKYLAAGAPGFWLNPAFWITVMLLSFPMMLLVDMFYVHPDNYDADGLRTQIVTGVLMVISMVGGFWLGTSFSSQRKTDLMTR